MRSPSKTHAEAPSDAAPIEGQTVPTPSSAPCVRPELEEAPSKPDERIVILVVEDDPGDRNLIRRAFEDCQDEVELRFAHDGEQAIDYMFRFRPYSSRHHAPRPSLILLDLNVPRMDGRQIIREIRQDPVLRVIPIVVLTGSEDDADVLRAYELGANSYFTKPSSMDGYCKIVRMLDAYWLRRVALPPVS